MEAAAGTVRCNPGQHKHVQWVSGGMVGGGAQWKQINHYWKSVNADNRPGWRGRCGAGPKKTASLNWRGVTQNRNGFVQLP